MSDLNDPSEQLRVIRSLMERATIYRAISAPMALVGGVLSLGAWGAAWHAALNGGLGPEGFLTLWLGVLVLTAACNVFFLWRGAARRGDNFFSPGMKSALASLAPAFIAAGVFTLADRRPLDLCVAWIVLYGLGLLATQHFAPRSLAALGWVFLASGCVAIVAFQQLLFVGGPVEGLMQGPPQPTALLASEVMAGTFGAIHLLYAAAVWLRGEEKRSVSEA